MRSHPASLSYYTPVLHDGGLGRGLHPRARPKAPATNESCGTCAAQCPYPILSLPEIVSGALILDIVVAAARLPHDPDALPLVDLERDAVDRHHLGRAHAELRPEVLNLQHRRHGPHTTAPGADIAGAAPGHTGFSSRPRTRRSRATTPRRTSCVDGWTRARTRAGRSGERGRVALVPLESVGREVLRLPPHEAIPRPPWPAPRRRPPRRTGRPRPRRAAPCRQTPTPNPADPAADPPGRRPGRHRVHVSSRSGPAGRPTRRATRIPHVALLGGGVADGPGSTHQSPTASKIDSRRGLRSAAWSPAATPAWSPRCSPRTTDGDADRTGPAQAPRPTSSRPATRSVTLGAKTAFAPRKDPGGDDHRVSGPAGLNTMGA